MRRAFLLASLFFLAAGAWGRELSARGSGSDEREAKQDALVNLTSFVFGEFVSSSFAVNTTEIAGSVNESASGGVYRYTVGELAGIDYRIVSVSGGEVVAEAFISSDKKGIYLEKMRDAIALYRDSPSLSMQYVCSVRIISYKYILLSLGCEMEEIPDAGSGFMNPDLILEKICGDNISEDNSILESSAELRARAELNDLKIRREAIDRQKILTARNARDMREKSVRAIVGSMTDGLDRGKAFGFESGDTLLENLVGFERLHSEYKAREKEVSELKKRYERLYSQAVGEVTDYYDGLKKEIKARPWLFSQKKNGEPMSTFVKLRNEEIRDLEAEMKKELESVRKSFSEVISVIEDGDKDVASMLNELKKSEKLLKGSASFIPGEADVEYNSDKISWTITLEDGEEMLSGLSKVIFDETGRKMTVAPVRGRRWVTSVSFERMTGSKPVTPSQIDRDKSLAPAFVAQNPTVERINRQLNNLNAYRLVAEYALKADDPEADALTYSFTITGMKGEVRRSIQGMSVSESILPFDFSEKSVKSPASSAVPRVSGDGIALVPSKTKIKGRFRFALSAMGGLAFSLDGGSADSLFEEKDDSLFFDLGCMLTLDYLPSGKGLSFGIGVPLVMRMYDDEMNSSAYPHGHEADSRTVFSIGLQAHLSYVAPLVKDSGSSDSVMTFGWFVGWDLEEDFVTGAEVSVVVSSIYNLLQIGWCKDSDAFAVMYGVGYSFD